MIKELETDKLAILVIGIVVSILLICVTVGLSIDGRYEHIRDLEYAKTGRCAHSRGRQGGVRICRGSCGTMVM